MYNAETAGEQMGSVCLAEVVPGVEQQKYIEYDVNRGRGDGKRA